MKRWTIFLDDGGVMSDHDLRGVQWQRLVSEFFVPQLGGMPEAWAEANRMTMHKLLEPAAWMARLQSARDFRDFDKAYQLEWLRGMCALVGVPAPADDEECYQLARQATVFVTHRVHAAFPGAIEAIRVLAQRGYALYTASGEPSVELAGYLEAMGVRDCFQRLYGPDLVNTFKTGPAFYERIFADAGVSSGAALVVDDTPQAIGWATQVGARAVLVGQASAALDGAVRCIAHLAALPALIESME